MDLTKLSEPLSVDEIDFKIKTINDRGVALLLAYKNARVDMSRLNAAVGPLNWKREHTRDNHNCIVSIWNPDIKQWVSKEDVGVESFAEAEKGLASDSFKRACFNWNIGVELYDYPKIFVNLKQDEFKIENGKARQTWGLKLHDWKWYSEFTEGKISFLAARDQKGDIRFKWGEMKKNETV